MTRKKQKLGAKLKAAEAGWLSTRTMAAKGKVAMNQLRLFGFHGSGKNAAKIVAAVVAGLVIGFNE